MPHTHAIIPHPHPITKKRDQIRGGGGRGLVKRARDKDEEEHLRRALLLILLHRTMLVALCVPLYSRSRIFDFVFVARCLQERKKT
jgi:hypothetical protein